MSSKGSQILFNLGGQTATAPVAESVLKQWEDHGMKKNRILPVLSRTDREEKEKLDFRSEEFKIRFKSTPHIPAPSYWAKMQIPYIPYYAYEEIPAVFVEESENPGNGLLYYYNRLCDYLMEREHSIIDSDKFIYPEEEERKKLKKAYLSIQTNSVFHSLQLPPSGANTPEINHLGKNLKKKTERKFCRYRDLQELERIWDEKKTNVLVVFGPEGSGKSTLLIEWLAEIFRKLKDKDRQMVFAETFKPKDSHTVDTIYSDLNNFFSPKKRKNNLTGEQLLVVLQKAPKLIVLDNFDEALTIHNGEYWLNSHNWSELIDGLGTQNAGLCILVTSHPIHQKLSILEHEQVDVLELSSISPLDTRDFFQDIRFPLTNEDKDLFSSLANHHILSLELVADLLENATGPKLDWYRYCQPSDISIWEDAEVWQKVDEMMKKYRESLRNTLAWVIWNLFSLFNRPVSRGILFELAIRVDTLRFLGYYPKLTESDFYEAINELVSLKLIWENDEGEWETYFIVTQYFRKELKGDKRFWQNIHEELFNHYLSVITKTPNSLPEMEELAKAIWHGVQVEGNHLAVWNELIWVRMYQEKKAYLQRDLGGWKLNLEVLSLLFQNSDASRILPQVDRLPDVFLNPSRDDLIIIGHMGYTLLHLGHLRAANMWYTKAYSEYRKIFKNQNEWEEYFVNTMITFCELLILQGKLFHAEEVIQNGVEYLDRIHHKPRRNEVQVTSAYIQFLMGNRETADQQFAKLDLDMSLTPIARFWLIQYYIYHQRVSEIRIPAPEEAFSPTLHALLYLTKGEIALANASIDEAMLNFEEAEQLLIKNNQVLYQPFALLGKAKCWQKMNDFDDAKQCLEKVNQLASGEMQKYVIDAKLEWVKLVKQNHILGNIKREETSLRELMRNTGYELYEPK